MGSPQFDYGFDPDAVDTETPEYDAKIDRWHDGALAALRYKPSMSVDPDYLEGYAYGLEQRRVRVVEVVRPEGYYHAPLGSFD